MSIPTGCSLAALERYLDTLEAVLADPRWDGSGGLSGPDLRIMPAPAPTQEAQARALLARITTLQGVLAQRMTAVRGELDTGAPRRQATRSYLRQDHRDG